MGKVIDASEAVFGEWYHTERWGVARCVYEQSEVEDRLPGFIVQEGPTVRLKWLHCMDIEHLPGRVGFKEKVESLPEPQWFQRGDLYLCIHGECHSKKTIVSVQGDIIEDVRGDVADDSWLPASARMILDNVSMDKRACAKIQELAGIEPDEPSGLPEITEGSVWHFDGWDHIVRRVPSGGPWVASPIGLPYCEVAPVCEDINDVFGDFRDEVKFVRQEPVKEEISGSASDSGCDIAPGEWVKWDGDLCCITKALPSGRFSLVAERTSTKWEAVCSEIEKLPKIGEWQDGPGRGNDYRLPVGTEFEIAAGLPKTTGRVVAGKPNDSCSNATWADKMTTNEPWVHDFADHRFRVTKYPPCPVVESEPKDGSWNSVEPGEGYRLVKPGEELLGTDEFWDHGNTEWKPRGGTYWDEMRPHFTPQRRKIEPDTPDPGEGWRLVDKEKDEPQEGDEWTDDGIDWLTCFWDDRVDKQFTDDFHYRRRDCTQWQEPLPIGGKYPLPIGASIQFEGQDHGAIVVSDKDAPCGSANAMCVGGSGGGNWVQGQDRFRWRCPGQSLWQEPVGEGGKYPVPAGTEIEVRGEKDDLEQYEVLTVADDGPDGFCNAKWDTGTWVRHGGVHEWRVVEEAEEEPASAFEAGDWVRSVHEGDRLMKVTEVISAEQVRVQFIDTGGYCSGVKNLRKVTFRPFASAEEFKPHRDRWVRCKGGSTCSITSYYEEGVRVRGALWSYGELLRKATFEDGMPCGVEVTE